MWEAVALTLAGAAGNNIGKVLQKKGTLILPPLSFKLKVMRRYALNRLWISGFLLDMCGAALMLTALSQAPVSVVQPIAGCGLAILCVFSHFYLKEVMNGLDWITITLAGIDTIGVGVGGEEQKVEEIPLFSIPWLVLCIVTARNSPPRVPSTYPTIPPSLSGASPPLPLLLVTMRAWRPAPCPRSLPLLRPQQQLDEQRRVELQAWPWWPTGTIKAARWWRSAMAAAGGMGATGKISPRIYSSMCKCRHSHPLARIFRKEEEHLMRGILHKCSD